MIRFRVDAVHGKQRQAQVADLGQHALQGGLIDNRPGQRRDVRTPVCFLSKIAYGPYPARRMCVTTDAPDPPTLCAMPIFAPGTCVSPARPVSCRYSSTI